MNKQEYQTFRQFLFQELDSLIEAKNSDYTSDDDAFGNFREAEDFGVSPLIGVVLRMSDKFKRVKSYCKTGGLCVQDESIMDAFKDIIGYSVMACAMINHENAEELIANLDKEITNDRDRRIRAMNER